MAVEIGNGYSLTKAQLKLTQATEVQRSYSGPFNEIFHEIEPARRLDKRAQGGRDIDETEVIEGINKLASSLLALYMGNYHGLGRATADAALSRIINHPDASGQEIIQMQRDIGNRIVADMAEQLARYYAKGKLVDNDASAEILDTALGVRMQEQPVFLEVIQVEGENGIFRPQISRIWGADYRNTPACITRYRAMLEEARGHIPELFTQDVTLGLVTLADSAIARMSDDTLRNQGVEAYELPLHHNHIQDFGAQVCDDAPLTRQAARNTRSARLQLAASRLAARQAIIAALSPDIETTFYDTDREMAHEPWQERLRKHR